MDDDAKTATTPSARKRVLAIYPSARVERMGLTFVAIRARQRNPDQPRDLRDLALGYATNEPDAWADAARKLEAAANAE